MDSGGWGLGVGVCAGGRRVVCSFVVDDVDVACIDGSVPMHFVLVLIRYFKASPSIMIVHVLV